MAFGIRVDLTPLQGRASKVLDLIDDLTPVLELAGLEFQAMVKEIFQDEGHPKWEPLTEYTKMMRRGDGDSAQILRDEGTLFNSIAEARGTDAVYDLQSNSLLIGSNLKYAAIHQFGWPAGNKHPPPTLPARPYMPNREELIARLAVEVHDYARDRLS